MAGLIFHHIMLNFPLMNASEPISWPVNIGSGDRLYALKQWAITGAQKMTQIYVLIWHKKATIELIQTALTHLILDSRFFSK